MWLLFYGSVSGLKSVLLLVCGWPEFCCCCDVWVELWFYNLLSGPKKGFSWCLMWPEKRKKVLSRLQDGLKWRRIAHSSNSLCHLHLQRVCLLSTNHHFIMLHLPLHQDLVISQCYLHLQHVCLLSTNHHITPPSYIMVHKLASLYSLRVLQWVIECDRTDVNWLFTGLLCTILSVETHRCVLVCLAKVNLGRKRRKQCDNKSTNAQGKQNNSPETYTGARTILTHATPAHTNTLCFKKKEQHKTEVYTPIVYIA